MKVCVVGCERSGTTIISHLLAKGCEKSFLNDPKDSWYIYPLVKVIGRDGFTQSLIDRIKKHDVVKVPGFASILPELKQVHRKSFKVVYVLRDPRDNYAAIKERRKQDFNGIYLNIAFLNKIGKSPVENIAIRWREFLKLTLAYKFLHSEDVLIVKYEDFLKEKLGTVKLIAEFVGFNLNEKLILQDLDKQINKSWSSEVRGEDRYLKDLSTEEISIINDLCKSEISQFDY